MSVSAGPARRGQSGCSCHVSPVQRVKPGQFAWRAVHSGLFARTCLVPREVRAASHCRASQCSSPQSRAIQQERSTEVEERSFWCSASQPRYARLIMRNGRRAPRQSTALWPVRLAVQLRLQTTDDLTRDQPAGPLLPVTRATCSDGGWNCFNFNVLNPRQPYKPYCWLS